MNDQQQDQDVLVLATGNQHKQEEILALLNDLPVTILTLRDFPQAPDIEEDGLTCEENAIKKAQGIAKYTGHVALADDTGLEVQALDGRPGVYAARYAGEHATYEDNCQKLLQELSGVTAGHRQARFLTVVAIVNPQGKVDVMEGTLEGEITEAVQGTQGFGYDPVFWLPDLHKTLAEVSLEEKNTISHRALALQKAKARLKTTWFSQIQSGRSAAR
ncbi:MAG: non-canonical purine NTP pyrophosphatase [Nitrospirales bacterium]|nr:MAG: non-canonical purine NTP pyrophosphatase [Nitrospirales bacterium]